MVVAMVSHMALHRDLGLCMEVVATEREESNRQLPGSLRDARCEIAGHNWLGHSVIDCWRSSSSQSLPLQAAGFVYSGTERVRTEYVSVRATEGNYSGL